MSPLDAAFLQAEEEEPAASLAIASIAVFEGSPPSQADFAAVLAGRLPLIPRYRQKAREVPLDLGPPVAHAAVPPEVVFDAVADERREPEYNPDMLTVEKVTPGPIEVGTRFRAVHSGLRRPVAGVVGRVIFSAGPTGTRQPTSAASWGRGRPGTRRPVVASPPFRVETGAVHDGERACSWPPGPASAVRPPVDALRPAHRVAAHP